MKKIFSMYDQELESYNIEDLQQENYHLFLDLVDAVALISRGM